MNMNTQEIIGYIKHSSWIQKRDEVIKGRVIKWTKENTKLPIRDCWCAMNQLRNMLYRYFVNNKLMKPLYS